MTEISECPACHRRVFRQSDGHWYHVHNGEESCDG
jgi:hypothetical protein